MKTNLRFAALIAASAMLFACDKTNDDSGKDATKPEPDVPDVTGTELKFDNLDVTYYAQEYSDGLDNFYLAFYNGTLNDDGDFTSDHEVLILDAYAPVGSLDAGLPAGTYDFADSTSLAQYKLLSGYTEEYTLREELEIYEALGFEIDWSDFTDEELAEVETYYYGSYHYTGKLLSDGDFDYDFNILSNGELTVARNGSEYTLTYTFKDADGNDYYVSYTGGLDIYDDTQDDSDDPGDDSGDDSGYDPSTYTVYDFNAYTQGELDYFGAESGYSYWSIFLGDANVDLSTLDGDGNLLWLYLVNTDASTTELKTGTYTLDYSVDQILVGAQGDSTGWSGTMFISGGDIIVAATGGSATVSKNGGNYTISADFWDDDYNVRYTASYTGPLTYANYSEDSFASSAAPASVKGLSFPSPKNFGAKLVTSLRSVEKHADCSLSSGEVRRGSLSPIGKHGAKSFGRTNFLRKSLVTR